MDKHKSPDKKIILGIVLIFIGSIWVLDNLNIIPGSWTDILISWQMLLIGLGALSRNNGNEGRGNILITIGVFFLLPDIISIPKEIREVIWPLFFIVLGILLIYLNNHSSKRTPINIEDQSNNAIDDFVIFGGKQVMLNSNNFVGGETTTIFGGSEYNLHDCQISDQGAVINCVALFGGCEIHIPHDWKVKNEVSAIFGGFSDKRMRRLNPDVTDYNKTLVIRGFAAFGGIEVKN